MTGSHADLFYLVLLLVLPVSALVARRLPVRQVATMAGAWLLIFAIGYVVIANGDRLGAGWSRLASRIGLGEAPATGGSVRIAESADGHFWVDAVIDGVPRHMLVDSGASVTALSEATARAAHIDTDGSPFAAMLQTANGPVAASRATVATLSIGPIAVTDVPVVVAPAFGDTDVVGMNVLSRLRDWGVSGTTLTLTGYQDRN